MDSRVRLADLLAGLSLVSDLGYGLPSDTALRSCVIGTALARRMGLAESEVGDVFYVCLLFHAGCTAYAHETTELFGDDLVVRRAAIRTDFSDVRDIFTTLIPESSRGLPVTRRLRSAVTMATRGPAFGRAHDQATCEVAREVARRIGLGSAVRDGLHDMHEWWNGRGARGLRGDEIALPGRIARVATETAELLVLDDSTRIVAALGRRAGKTLDPDVVECLVADAEQTVADVMAGDPRTTVLDVEPEPALQIEHAELPSIAAAFGDMADLKTPFTHGHSKEVARLAVAAAERLGLNRPAVEQLNVAAHLHDLGRIGVSNRVWNKAGPWTSAEWEQAKLHSYHSERILASTPALAPMAALAGMAHERLDGSGYTRGSSAGDIGLAARVLAAADACQAMSQHRPHRRALAPDEAADTLADEARAGRLDPDAVSAVLAAAGEPRVVSRSGARPGGLSDREVEVLGLLAQGCSNPEIGRALGISRRTAEHHVQHIYTKIGVSTRPAAALFAVEHDLLVKP